MKLLVLGDSLTAGYGMLKRIAWTAQVARNLGATVFNRGICGDTTAGMLARLYREISETQPEYVLIWGGSNDVFLCHDCSYAKGNIAAMVQQSVFYGVKPILITPLPVEQYSMKPQWEKLIDPQKAEGLIAQYVTWIFDYSESFQIPVIDCFHTFSAKIKNQNTSGLYLDGIHPNDHGHQIIAEQICNFFYSTGLEK